MVSVLQVYINLFWATHTILGYAWGDEMLKCVDFDGLALNHLNVNTTFKHTLHTM